MKSTRWFAEGSESRPRLGPRAQLRPQLLIRALRWASSPAARNIRPPPSALGTHGVQPARPAPPSPPPPPTPGSHSRGGPTLRSPLQGHPGQSEPAETARPLGEGRGGGGGGDGGGGKAGAEWYASQSEWEAACSSPLPTARWPEQSRNLLRDRRMDDRPDG